MLKKSSRWQTEGREGTKNGAYSSPALVEKEMPSPEDSGHLLGWCFPQWRKNIFQALLAEESFIKKPNSHLFILNIHQAMLTVGYIYICFPQGANVRSKHHFMNVQSKCHLEAQCVC